MSSSLNKLSTLVEHQLPQFIRDDHPIFVEFLQRYYEFLEQPGNPIYEFKKFEDNYDVDSTRESLLKYFKNKILPSFPETTELSTERILKSAKDFYTKKGTPDSFKFLFRVLYNKDLEVFFPKLQIFKASDGKWILPQAFRLTLTGNNLTLDLNKIENRKGFGSISRASCIIEAANHTIDKSTNKEIVEIYVSNLNRFFQNGEKLEIDYVDDNGANQTFSEKIIGALSNIYIKPTRRGTKYVTGDPVIINGGLDDTSETKIKAVATVGNVTTGSIDSVTVLSRGYGFRTSPNSLVDIISANGVGANVIISTVDSANQIQVSYSTDSILYKKGAVLNVADYDFDNAFITYANSTNGAGNTTTTINLKSVTFSQNSTIVVPSTVTDYYKSLCLTVISGIGVGGSPNSATITAYNGTTKIATLSNALGIAPGANSNVAITSNSNTTLARAFSFETLNLSPILTTLVVNGGANFDAEPTLNVVSLYESDYSLYEGNTNGQSITVTPGEFNTYNNVNSSIKFVGAEYPAEDDYFVGWRILVEKQFRNIIDYDGTTKTAFLNRKFEENINQTNILTKNLYLDVRPVIQDMGRIAAIEILNGGTGYAATNVVQVIGTGYNLNVSLTVSGTGTITAVTISDRGEGYPIAPDLSVTSATGTGAVLTAVLFSDGEDFDVITNKIGQIKDFTITNRGSDYVTTPNVSLKIYDINVASILEVESILENDIVYQGANSNSTSFRATVDEYYPANNILRVFNFSGTPNVGQNLIVYKATTANVNALVQYANVDGKIYPYKYGDGKAKANAEFLNGLIKYNGFYLNTDGHISSDKKLQDSKKYHNFSYSLVSETAYSDYSKTILDIAHPAGTVLIPVRAIKDDIIVLEKVTINAHSIVLISNTLTTNCNVGYESANVTGQAENLDTVANTNDFIIINSANTLRSFAKVITAVANNNHITVESPCILVGQGRAKTNTGNTWLQISGNSNNITTFIDITDRIKIGIQSMNISGTVNVSGSTVTGNTTGGNTTYFLGNVIVGSVINVNSEIRTVTVVTNAASLTVNSAFSYAATNKYLYANTQFTKNVASISGNVIVMNSAIWANSTNQIYQIAPQFNVVEYKIIRTNH